MPLSSLPRGLRTVLVGFLLIALYAGYSRLTKPWLTVERKQSGPMAQRVVHEKSAVINDLSSRWFPEDQWVAEAGGRFRDGGRLLFFQEHELFNDNRSIRVSPVALLWQQDKDKPPITATADSAQLDASTKFSFEEGQFGKITSGLLAGVVRITGPDGLRIEGRTFYISDDALKVWTGQPVKFRWGTHTGEAAGGAEIELLSSGDASREGLMSVSDVQRIKLLGRITCDLYFDDENKRREPVKLHVSAANGFDFFVPTLEATFYGFMDRELRLDNQILITRPTATGGLDRLFCSKLVLHLQPEISVPGEASDSSQLELSSLTAEGRRVEFDSSDQGVTATMSRLRYRLTERVLELNGGLTSGTNQMRHVEVHQDGRRLTAPQVLIGHDEFNEVHTVDCRGPGSVGQSARSTAQDDLQAMDVSWTESLLLQRGDQPKVTIRGEAHVSQPAHEIDLAGDVLELILKDDQLAATQPDDASLSIARLQPQLLTATGNVRMNSLELSATARERLVVTFLQAADVATPLNAEIRNVSAVSDPSGARGAVASDRAQLPDGSTVCTSDTIELAAGLIERDGRRTTQFSDVWLKGDVSVVHTAAKAEESFSAEGNALFAKEGFRGNREISLFGDPAVVVNAANRFEMQRIDLTEVGRSASPQRDVRGDGSGRVRFVIHDGLDGQPLDRQSPLDIYWSDRMSFSGRTATFVGSIRAVMNNETDHDVQLTCSILKVHFADGVKLERTGASDEYQAVRSGPASSAGDIERIECLGRVVVDIDVMKAGAVVARHHAEFSDLNFHQQTGDFTANGPGLVESVQPDTGEQLTTTTRAIARANVPVKAAEETFAYLRATFIGRLEGNRNDRFAQLRQHVRGVFGPVRRLDEKLDINGLNADQLPEKTGLLGCENLTIATIPGAMPDEHSFSLVAESNSADSAAGTHAPCRLESHQFSGDADKITYDHAKQQFIVSADHGRQARVTHRPDRGEPQNLIGRSFQYDRDRNQLTANQITGVQASEGQ